MARVILTGSLLEVSGISGPIDIDARNVRQLMRKLETRVPGFSKHVEGLAIAIDGDIVQDPMLEPVDEETEIHFLPPIRGGAA